MVDHAGSMTLLANKWSVTGDIVRKIEIYPSTILYQDVNECTQRPNRPATAAALPIHIELCRCGRGL